MRAFFSLVLHLFTCSILVILPPSVCCLEVGNVDLPQYVNVTVVFILVVQNTRYIIFCATVVFSSISQRSTYGREDRQTRGGISLGRHGRS